MCGQHLHEDLVNLTVLHVRWSSCCDSLKDAPNKKMKKIEVLYTEKNCHPAMSRLWNVALMPRCPKTEWSSCKQSNAVAERHDNNLIHQHLVRSNMLERDYPFSKDCRLLLQRFTLDYPIRHTEGLCMFFIRWGLQGKHTNPLMWFPHLSLNKNHTNSAGLWIARDLYDTIVSRYLSNNIILLQHSLHSFFHLLSIGIYQEPM